MQPVPSWCSHHRLTGISTKNAAYSAEEGRELKGKWGTQGADVEFTENMDCERMWSRSILWHRYTYHELGAECGPTNEKHCRYLSIPAYYYQVTSGAHGAVLLAHPIGKATGVAGAGDDDHLPSMPLSNFFLRYRLK